MIKFFVNLYGVNLFRLLPLYKIIVMVLLWDIPSRRKIETELVEFESPPKRFFLNILNTHLSKSMLIISYPWLELIYCRFVNNFV